MEAPKCMHCGGRHWSNQPCPAKTKSMKEPPGFSSADPQRSVAPKRKPGGAGGSTSSPKAGGSRSKPEAKGAGKVIRKSTKPAPKPIAGARASAPDRVRRDGNATATPATSKIAKGLKEAASGKVKVVAKKVQPAPAKRPAHRPRLTPEGFDKKAYQREYMREYRAKLKAKAKKRAKAK